MPQSSVPAKLGFITLSLLASILVFRGLDHRRRRPRFRHFKSRQERVEVIAQEIVQMLLSRDSSRPDKHSTLWVGICGIPGAGKTTFADNLVQEITMKYHISTRVVPMDGYHYYRKDLDLFPDRELAHNRRGAPFTFNAGRFAAEIRSGRDSLDRHGRVAFFPSFDHSVGDPIEHGVQVAPETRIVLVEGNYLLLDEEGWREARQVLDHVYFLNVEVDTAKLRLAKRHAQVWNWPLEKAMQRVDANDYLNMLLIGNTMHGADEILQDAQ